MAAVRDITYRFSWAVVFTLIVLPMAVFFLIGAIAEAIIMVWRMLRLYRLVLADRAYLEEGESVLQGELTTGHSPRVAFPAAASAFLRWAGATR